MRTSMVVVAAVVLVAAAVAAYCFDEKATTMASAPKLMTRTSAAARDEVAIEVDVGVHPKSTPLLTEADVTAIAADGSSLLENTEFAGDVACAVKIVLRKLNHIRIGDGIVDSPVAFDALFIDTANLPLAQKTDHWQVRVVKEISWCNTFVPAGGCADVNGRRIAVARRPSPIEGILWAHEIGHTQGLLHRTDSNVALMRPSILPDHNLLTQTECDAFRK
jgi:hypothetical protein